MTSNFFHPSLLLLFLDPGFEIRDPRSGIRDPGWVKIRIRDKHPGSATLPTARVADPDPGFSKNFWIRILRFRMPHFPKKILILLDFFVTLNYSELLKWYR